MAELQPICSRTMWPVPSFRLAGRATGHPVRSSSRMNENGTLEAGEA